MSDQTETLPAAPKIDGLHITSGFAEALAKFQSDIPKIERDREVEVETKGDKPNYGYSYATLAHISSVVLPKLGKLGLAWTALPTLGSDGKPVLRFALMHTSGGFISGEFPIKGEGGYQSIGSAITYVRRYCLQAVTGVAAEEDDDAARADEEQRQAGTTTARRKATQARESRAAENTSRVARQRADQARPTSAPPADQEDAGQPQRRNPDGPVTAGEQKKLFAQCRDVGLDKRGDEGRTERLNALSDLLGKELFSINDLKSGEAGELIELLDVVIAAGPTVESRQEALVAARAAARSGALEDPDTARVEQ